MIGTARGLEAQRRMGDRLVVSIIAALAGAISLADATLGMGDREHLIPSLICAAVAAACLALPAGL